MELKEVIAAFRASEAQLSVWTGLAGLQISRKSLVIYEKQLSAKSLIEFAAVESTSAVREMQIMGF